MKKIALILMIAFISVNTVTAQSSERESDLRFAFVLSPQLSWLKSDHSKTDGNGNLMGYNFGIEMDKFFAPNYAFSTGLTINTTGGHLRYIDETDIIIGGEVETLDPNESLEYRLKYIEVPLCLKLQTSDFQRSSYYGIFGLSGQINIKTNNGSGKSLSEEVRLMNFGYKFGGGMQYSVGGSTYLKLGVTYNQGLTDITKNSTVNDKVVLNRLVFNFGVIF
ncbi:porin family protein [Labilibacter marinus]|uniref:porin family protein n=1 Tax=Labilibacter marinus TaxID=1477105 RepID=UPI00082D18E5|nr:porin family protein [Labilibacter marinus]